MSYWDEGIVLYNTKYKERSELITIFTKDHGLYRGLVYTTSKKKIPDIGSVVKIFKKSNKSTGLCVIELESSYSPYLYIFDSSNKVFTMQAQLNLISAGINEGDFNINFYDLSLHFIYNIKLENWYYIYINWELNLIKLLGFGLDLSVCALTGATDNLYYASPITGKVCTKEAGAKYHDKLLVIPKFLRDHNYDLSTNDYIEGLYFTEVYLKKSFSSVNKIMPNIRLNLIELIR